MLRGFTLLESLFVLLIISLMLFITLPKWNALSDSQVLNQEQEALYTFIRQVQARAENSSEIWYLVASQNIAQQTWCLTAQIKSDQICDCLSPHSCVEHLSPHIYSPHFPQRTMLVAKKFYPQELTKISGVRNTFVSSCFILQANNLHTLFQLSNTGKIKISPSSSLSACQEGGE